MSETPFPEQVRWKQRYQNYSQALATLQEALAALQKEPQNHLYEIALVGAFKFTFELGWKTLKDYLRFKGGEVSLPRDVIKQAFQHELLADGQVWIDMLADRNLLSHVYDAKAAVEAIRHIQTRYFPAVVQLDNFFKAKLGES
jgi:nucleotidyltransferase substrate binding protein (TIGR01987 family)